MRIWDIPVSCLCRRHLLGEHRELHAVWTILTRNKRGYRRHPETLRWEGKLKALYRRHLELVEEMAGRGYRHRSPLDPELATGSGIQDIMIDSIEEQHRILCRKGCDCRVSGSSQS